MAKKVKAKKQAPALSVKQWSAWLQFVRESAGPRMYFVVFLTGALCLRMGEALALKREDLQLDAEDPFIHVKGVSAGAKKSPGKVFVSAKNLKLLKAALKNGIAHERVVNTRHGEITKTEVFKVPTKGFLFRSRANATAKHLSYQAAYHSITKLAPKFLEKTRHTGSAHSAELGNIRPHSGRATSITTLMGAGLSLPITMKWARHAPGSVKVHLRYGQLTHSDVKNAIAHVDRKDFPDIADAKTKDLEKMLRDIKKELKCRGKNIS